MKKLISLLAVVLLVSSCGNRMMLVKRHYTKGYYVQHAAHAEKPKTNVTRQPAEPTILQPVLVSLSQAPQEPLMTASLKDEPVLADRQADKIHVESFDRSVGGSSLALAQTKKVVVHAWSVKGGKGGGDANIVLLVILSLFPLLALLAMYLHDGNQVTANFWVDLVLHITIVGYAIFALLVVFGVVDLA